MYVRNNAHCMQQEATKYIIKGEGERVSTQQNNTGNFGTTKFSHVYTIRTPNTLLFEQADPPK